jgi:hypothetical protein
MGAPKQLPRINLALVTLIALLFVLPFATISCSGTTLVKATGYQLAIGSSPDNVLTAAGHQIIAASPRTDLSGRKPPLWSATAALVFVLLAGALSFGSGQRLNAIAWRAGICFGLSGIALVYMQSELQRAWENHGYALTPFVLSMQPAYWVALTLCALGAVVNIGIAFRSPSAETTS